MRRQYFSLGICLFVLCFGDTFGQSSTEPNNGVDDSRLCKDSTMDLMFNAVGGDIHVLKGENYGRITPYGSPLACPKLISEVWSDLPKNIDAAFTSSLNDTYFFNSTHYWRYNGARKLNDNYPLLIKSWLPDIPNDLDAIATSGKDVYFFKGSVYWQCSNPETLPFMVNNEKRISGRWTGVPSDLDAVLNIHGVFHFFKGGKVWIYQIDGSQVKWEESSNNPWPTYWSRCRREK